MLRGFRLTFAPKLGARRNSVWVDSGMQLLLSRMLVMREAGGKLREFLLRHVSVDCVSGQQGLMKACIMDCIGTVRVLMMRFWLTCGKRSRTSTFCMVLWCTTQTLAPLLLPQCTCSQGYLLRYSTLVAASDALEVTPVFSTVGLLEKTTGSESVGPRTVDPAL
eukprot:5692861-Amphidinium_carterae.1